MRFKVLILSLLFCVLSCREFDDSYIWSELENLKERIEWLEDQCDRMNSNILSLKSVVTALQNNDYITSVSPITDDGGVEIGYMIGFS